jgi:hypothetical protein
MVSGDLLIFSFFLCRVTVPPYFLYLLKKRIVTVKLNNLSMKHHICCFDFTTTPAWHHPIYDTSYFHNSKFNVLHYFRSNCLLCDSTTVNSS